MPTELVDSHPTERHRPSELHFDDDKFDIMEHLREIASTPTPLEGILSDPSLFSAFTKCKSKKNKGAAGSSASALGLVLVEEERQAYQLKSALRRMGDRLEYEMRRADSAESRAREATSRAVDAETMRRDAQLESTRVGEEVRRYQMQLSSVERELVRAKGEISLVEQQRVHAEEGTERARNQTREFQNALRDWEAREEEFQERRRVGMQKWYNEGHADGWGCGREAGFAEGRKVGQREGYAEGWEQGWREERQNALQAFDRFLENDLDDSSESRQERTRQWAESIYVPRTLMSTVGRRR